MNRLIPALLLTDRGLCKTRRFAGGKYVGDPTNAVRILSEKDIDEVVLLDIVASKEGRPPNYELLRRVASECFAPIAYGGAITSLNTAKAVIDCGFEKVVINTAAIDEPGSVELLAASLGSQAVVVGVDYIGGGAHAQQYDHRSRQTLAGELFDRIQLMVNAGAGELLLTSVDRDGMRTGPDLETISLVANVCDVPLIYAGGTRSLDDASSAIAMGASAVCAGSMFVFRGPHEAVLITYPSGHQLRRENLTYE